MIARARRVFRYQTATYTYRGGTEVLREQEGQSPRYIHHRDFPAMSVEAMASALDLLEFPNPH